MPGFYRRGRNAMNSGPSENVTMHTMIRVLVASLLFSAAVFAQSRPVTVVQGGPAFEVASIRPSADQPSQVNVGLRVSESQVRISFFSLKDYIGMAYSLKPHLIEGPEWLSRVRFEIAGKMPDGSTTAQVPQMLQALLADRFQLKAHRETKEAPVYVLGVAREGLRIEESPVRPNAADAKSANVEVAAAGNIQGVAVDLGDGSSFNFGDNKLAVTRMTMTQLAEMLTRFVDRPVVDQTGLTGKYDVTLELTPEDYMGMLIRSAVTQGVNVGPQALRLLDGASNDPLSAPLKKAGLTFEARRAPLEFLVVDSMLQAPTDN
jgi:uncharacterized protein (TIGR03435 family)